MVLLKRKVLKFGFYSMVGMMVTALYNIVDTYFVSTLGDYAIGGISIVFPIMMITAGIGFAFGTSGASYISRLLGEKNNDKSKIVWNTCFFMTIFFSLFIVLFILVFFSEILLIFGATKSIVPYAKEYGFIIVFGAAINAVAAALTNMLRATGKIKESLIGMIIGAVINIFLDPIFILVLKLGIKGAAIATVISQSISLVYLITLHLKKEDYISIDIKKFTFKKDINKEIFKMGTPVFIYQILSSVSIAVLNQRASMFGDEVIIAMGIVNRIMLFLSYIIYGFTKGIMPIIGYAHGEKNYVKEKYITNYVIKIMTAYTLVAFLIAIINLDNILNEFSSNISIIELSKKSLIASLFSFITLAFQMTYIAFFMAIGRAKEGAVLGLSRQGLILIPIISLIFAIRYSRENKEFNKIIAKTC